MDIESNIQQSTLSKHTCLFCQSFIKKSEDIIFCPECNSPYHLECWYENGGCALYGCKHKITFAQFENRQQESVQVLLLNAEYLLNINKFPEAINECRRILNSDPKNNDAKILHNKAVKLVNAKTKLIEDGDKSYEDEKFNEAKILYGNALKYADDIETILLNSKLQVLEEKIPKLQRKKRINRILSILITLIIISCFAYLYYYFIFLADLREFSGIAKNDGNLDIQVMEQQISRYEKFLVKYSNSKYTDEVKNKISLISAIIVSAIHKEDWRLALEYLAKIDEKETKNDLYKKIYLEASNEYKKLVSNAKQFNKLRKYTEAKTELEKANLVIDRFQNSDLANEKSKVNANIILIERKRKAIPEISSLEQKINDLSTKLKNYQNTDVQDIIEIEGEVTDKQNDPPYIILKRLKNKKQIAISGDVGIYKKGEFISLTCKKAGTVSYGDEELPEYETYSKGIYNFPGIEKESLLIELNNLKSRKQKLDSLININLGF